MYKTFLSLILALFVFGPIFGQGSLVLRQPAINNDATKVAFSYQGDIWTISADGGKATRLTIHEAYEGNPIFSPDGTQIAFGGNRFGNEDIFVIPTDGGTAKRLTFHSGADYVTSWAQADKIMFSTAREFRQIERPYEVYTINPKGGTEERFLDAVAHDPTLSPDGRFLAFVRGDINPVARKDYEGSSNRELWIYDTKNKTYQQLPTFKTNDIFPKWASNNTLYFLSSDGGEYNLYRHKIDGKGKVSGVAEKLTNFKDESIRDFDISADGNTVVFEKDMNLYLMKTNGGSPQKLNVEINADNRFDETEWKTFSREAEGFVVSPNGKLMAFEVRGEIFVKEADKDMSRSVNVSNHAFRDVEPAWLNDSTLLFSSDRSNGNFDIYMVRSSDKEQPNIFKSLKHELLKVTNTTEDETGLVVSPDGKMISYIRGMGTFVVSEIDEKGKLSKEKILNDTWSAPYSVAWSPDSKYLAYAQSDLYFNREIFIQAADGSIEPVNVSMHPRSDSQPFWSGDGTKLGFISGRSVGRSSDVWFVWLKKADWEKESQDWKEYDKPEEPKKKEDKKEVKPIEIDFKDIHERIVQVTSFSGDESSLAISKDGETFYYTTESSTAKGRDLYSIKWDGKDLKELTKGGSGVGSVTMDKEGKFLYFTKRGSINRMELKTSKVESLPYVAKMKIDYLGEKEQVFEEAWRTIRDGFYDPTFHGNDWLALKGKYKERTINASTTDDFADMFNLMLGELNASHMGMRVPERAETQKETTGLLGTEIKPVKGGVEITHVIPDSPADKIASKLIVGDVITAVNGNPVLADENFYNLLNGLANEKTLLSVKGAKGEEREVTIRLTSSLRTNLYNEWVDERKKLVDTYSNGRLGYIHIQGMNFPSFEVVEREFTAAGYGKEGIVVDVRYNGGGSTTDYLMTILNYKQHAYTIPRGATDNPERDKLKFSEYYPIGERLVYAAWTGPSIALCNEGSYSNAEIFSHAYKHLGIGKLVGTPTNGSVISTGGKGLMDGSFIRLPRRGWYTKATNENQELGPAVPDIIVENDINWIAKGEDKQLKVATEELLKQIEERK
ncbi:C-terminal processing protease CtpA/Prc, contains a PDZ domain [Spirosomataceae bacterium TFI 002]|nr:C-terminal processing protease CtpA/Prc, contains a PDZ domain [Spirosomataceae bacterium TFI 002]